MAENMDMIYVCYACNDRNARTRESEGELVCESCGMEGFIEKVETRSALDEARRFVRHEDAEPREADGGNSAATARAPPPNIPQFSLAVFGGSGVPGTSNVDVNLGENAGGPVQLRQRLFTSLIDGLQIENQRGGGFAADFGMMLDGLTRMSGDYVIGEGGLNAVIQHLTENDPNQYGNPPAAKDAVNALPKLKVTESILGSEDGCAVCKDAFELDQECVQMPCSHIFCESCISPWLERHNTCPVCRFELRTDDADYERRRVSAQARQDSQAATARQAPNSSQ
ncbi:hypothetical protein NDN08_002370 [Rhodosorus marinus]|uniref:RING-type domain-containing protein n=1 Tax=Rhodosorus marinus TaxID=101924 RepID=A0AAV8UTJ0_9RHOD|nr:hypothetical protein NDN08_002370 [Rhodosorus marinus]